MIITEAPLPRKIGFGLMVHSEDTTEGILELLEKIYRPEHCYIIHFDLKTPRESIEKFTKTYPEIKITEKSYDIEWGSFNMVRAQLELQKVECDYEHFVYLDGSSYPMRPMKYIEDDINNIPIGYNIVFSNDPGYGSEIPTCKEGSPTMQACSRSGARCIDAECTKYSDTPLNGPIYKGPQWSILSKPFITYLKSRPDWVEEWIAYFEWNYMIADEAFFPTLMMNSPFSNHHFLFKQDWLRTVWLDCKSEHTQMSSIGYSPCLLGLEDYEPHLKTSTALFLRKVKVGSKLKTKLFESFQPPTIATKHINLKTKFTNGPLGGQQYK